MLYNIDNKILKEAIETYGMLAQKITLMEELSELQKEICKELRGNENLSDLIFEIADVYIMLEQIKMVYNVDEAQIENMVTYKMDRLKIRLLKERSNKEK